MLKKIKTAKTFLQVTTFLCMALCFAQVSRGVSSNYIEAVFSKQALTTQETKKKMKQSKRAGLKNLFSRNYESI